MIEPHLRLAAFGRRIVRAIDAERDTLRFIASLYVVVAATSALVTWATAPTYPPIPDTPTPGDAGTVLMPRACAGSDARTKALCLEYLRIEGER
jgi:hypothetical protein